MLKKIPINYVGKLFHEAICNDNRALVSNFSWIVSKNVTIINVIKIYHNVGICHENDPKMIALLCPCIRPCTDIYRYIRMFVHAQDARGCTRRG